MSKSSNRLWIVALVAVAGAILNRYRGAGIWAGRIVNALVFWGVIFWLMGPVWAGTLTLMMYLGSAPGWGVYIGAIIGNHTGPLKEFGPVDWMTKPLMPTLQADGSRGLTMGYPKLQLRIWGLVALGLRGMFWGLCLAVGALAAAFFTLPSWGEVLHLALTMTPFIAVTGLMGLTYGVSLALARSYLKAGQSWEGIGWEAGEVGFGALVWGSFVATIIN